MNQLKTYLPLLEEFCRQNEKTIEDSVYPYIPFLPVAFNNYEKSDLKIFYVGIDTYYWIEGISNLLDCYRTHTLATILDVNNNEVTPNRILHDWYSNKGRFWEFVCKLHLYIRSGKILSNDDLRRLSPDEVELIGEIGWGNMNSIELKKTLKKEERWNVIDASKYSLLKKSSEDIIDPIKNLILAYNPDYIILMGWGESEEQVFKGLDYEPIDEFYVSGIRALYTTKDFKAKIVWTSHPSRFSFLKTNQDEMITCVGDSLKLF